jgi:FKBP-type peptidyl-prolyl cis-trans isomerase SlyD
MSLLAIGPDAFVTISYVLFDESGEPVDSATPAEPLTYVHGYAQIVPGLERGLAGCHAGDRRELTVAPDDAFGARDDEAVFEVEKADFPNHGDVAVGDEFVAQGPDGDAIAMRVVEVLPDAFLVDTNHPLAGQKVRFEVEVASVRPASEEEIAGAQADLEQELHGDGCCGHDHDDGHDHGDDHHHEHHHGAPALVQLTKKS